MVLMVVLMVVILVVLLVLGVLLAVLLVLVLLLVQVLVGFGDAGGAGSARGPGDKCVGTADGFSSYAG